MRREWDPEILITPELAARTIAAQWPELAHLPVQAFDAGWDNAVLAVGEHLLFRFVHRDIALDGSRRELAVLPFVARRLPLPVPEPVFVGRPTDDVPWPFWGGPRLAGVGLAESGVAAEHRGTIARQLGGFLRALHGLSEARGADAATPAATLAAVRAALPVDPIRRNQPAFVAVRAAERLEALVAHSGATSEVGRSADEALRASAALRARAADLPAGPGHVVLHGDLHVRHVLVDPAPGPSPTGGEPVATGVIDWGDTQLGDPAIDLMIGWAAFEERERAAFLAAYGDVPPERALHAQVLALAVTAALATQANADRHATVLVEALAALRRASGA